MEIALIILSCIIIVLAWIIRNLLKKNEKCEDIILEYETYISNISKTLSYSDTKLKEIDAKGSFEGDDEVGFFFKQIKILQELLNDFKIQQ